MHRESNISVSRHDSPLGRWTVTVLRPHPLLARAVHQIWHGEGRVAYARDRILPSTQSYLYINLGPPQYVVRPDLSEVRVSFDDIWFSAINERPIDTEAPQGSVVVGIAFTATGAAALFPRQQSELALCVGPAADLVGSEALRLRERLLHVNGAATRLALVQEWLLGICVSGRRIHPLVHWATEQLAESGGTLRTLALAREAGCSRKHLTELFRRDVGIAPKPLARIYRFRHALAHARRARVRSWSELAFACGYCDQSHLIHEFRRFSGLSPERLAQQAMPDPGSIVVT